MDSAMALAPAMAAPMPNTLMPSQTRGDWRISEREVEKRKVAALSHSASSLPEAQLEKINTSLPLKS